MKRLPTKAEFKALLKLPNKWDEKRKWLVFTASNGNELFLTASGYRWGAYVYNVGNGGYYWSATPYNKGKAWYLYFSSFEALLNNYSHNFGRTIRLISDNPCNGYIDMGTGIYWAIENYHEGEKIYFTWDETLSIPDKVNNTAGLLMKKDRNTPEFNISDTLNWEYRRYEIAKAALAGLCANAQPINRGFTSTAQLAVAYADALIAELLKGGEE